MPNRPKHEKLMEDLGESLKEKGGKPWLKKTKFPKKDDVEAIDTFKKVQAGKAYVRLAALAGKREVLKKNPGLYIDLQRFLWETAYGKPKQQAEGEISLPIRDSFELIKRPGEYEEPQLLAEAKVIDESSGVKEADTSDPITVD